MKYIMSTFLCELLLNIDKKSPGALDPRGRLMAIYRTFDMFAAIPTPYVFPASVSL